jgi:hypothetical protein
MSLVGSHQFEEVFRYGVLFIISSLFVAYFAVDGVRSFICSLLVNCIRPEPLLSRSSMRTNLHCLPTYLAAL